LIILELQIPVKITMSTLYITSSSTNWEKNQKFIRHMAFILTKTAG